MMEVAAAAPWTDMLERNQASGRADTLLGGSSLTLAPLMADSVSVRRSQPIFITSHRARSESCSSVPSIPNPFPELCSPSKSPVLISSLPPQSSAKHLIKVYGEDSHSRPVWVSSGATAREVCHLLVQTAHCSDQENWALLEVHPTLGLERCLEDHEVVLEVQASWSLKSDTRFVFCKNYAKYEFFRKPMLFFPECMISDSADVTKAKTSSALIQNLLKSGACPEIQGFLHLKEPNRKSWKKVYFFLRRSGLYSSTKGSSKEPRHLQYVADLNDLNVYSVVNSRKLYGAPNDFTFCIKSSRSPVRSQDLKMMCAENEQTRRCWTSAFRLFKYGKQLQCNYQLSKSTPVGAVGSGRKKTDRIDVRGQPCSHGFLGEGRRTGHPEPSRGPERGTGGRASLEEARGAEVQSAQPKLWAQTFLRPRIAAVVPWGRVQKRSSAADREAGPGGRHVPDPGEPAARPVLRPVTVSSAEDQTLPGDPLRRRRQEVLHHRRRPDALY
uniref:Growth factor receptor bound protein 7 n=1 Tax=Takifugu rubripes TaxID=31033 RepID=H2SZ58_TAKRU